MKSSPGAPASPVPVTDAAGFIGSHFVDRLLTDRGEAVGVDDLSNGRLTNLPRHPVTRLSASCIWTSCRMLLTLVADVRPEVVVDLAAQMDVRKSVSDPLHDARVNVLGTVNVLEAATRAGARKVVFASSGGTVYGQPTASPVAEDAPLPPSSPYGAAKVAG